MSQNINFVSLFKTANYLSIIVFLLSVIFIFLKGLNYGIDFKGGTLIELRTDKSVKVSSIRDAQDKCYFCDLSIQVMNKRCFINIGLNIIESAYDFIRR